MSHLNHYEVIAGDATSRSVNAPLYGPADVNLIIAANCWRAQVGEVVPEAEL